MTRDIYSSGSGAESKMVEAENSIIAAREWNGVRVFSYADVALIQCYFGIQ